ncbi:MAG: Insulinase (Peptidase M16) [Pleopsidium flavum]|nr:MAG: Insulinase (Peptidase M16) [Pleopsidium flavum]
MVAQLSPKAIAGTIDSAEQKGKVVTLLGKYLNSLGLAVDSEKLEERFEDVDVTGGDQRGIIKTIEAYLSEDIKLEDGRAEDVIEQGQQLLGTVLPSLGIEVLPANMEDGEDVKSDDVPVTKTTTFIGNVHEYKAELQVSAGARPVKDLSEFEDMEPKL